MGVVVPDTILAALRLAWHCYVTGVMRDFIPQFNSMGRY